MVDQKLSALTELAATPESDDEVYIRDVSEAAAAESKRITADNLLASRIKHSLATVLNDFLVASGSGTFVKKNLAQTIIILAHASAHQNGGVDEVSLTGLSGLLADDQHVLDSEVTNVAIAKALLTTRGDIIFRNATVPARLAKGSSGQVLTMGADDPAWAAAGAGGGLGAVIAESILGSDAASITFSSIPGTYRHLLVVVKARGDRAGQVDDILATQFNSDTGANYYNQQLVATAASVSSSESLGQNEGGIGRLTGDSATANHAAANLILISDYASTNWKKDWVNISNRPSTLGSGNLLIGQHGGIWNNTAAITAIKFFSKLGSNFRAGTVITLYGLKGA